MQTAIEPLTARDVDLEEGSVNASSSSGHTASTSGSPSSYMMNDSPSSSSSGTNDNDGNEATRGEAGSQNGHHWGNWSMVLKR